MPEQEQEQLEQNDGKPKPRLRGTVRFFRADLGYGFIACPQLGHDVFAHHTCLEMDGYRHLEEGQIVEFELGKRDGRLQANRVVVLEGDNGNS